MSVGRSHGEGAARPSRLYRLAGVVVRRPRMVLGIWLTVVVLLALQGLGLENRLSTPAVYIDGTQSAREHELSVRAFGDEDALIVMLRGPKAAVDRQGRQIDRTLDALPRTRVVSPWRGQTLKGLRPAPGTAAVVVSVGRLPGQQYIDILPPVRKTVERVVRAPVTADLSGSPVIVEAMRDSAFDAATTGEMIALPILIVVLLLVFRSVLAAAIPAIIGGTTVAASRGALGLLVGHVQLDSLATGLAAMMGLGLGVDYSLLVVSRFREEMKAGGDLGEAVRTTVATTGRAVLLAGVALFATMLVAAQLLPGAIITSAAFSIITASLFSVLSALFVVPAMLTLVGSNLERWSLPSRHPEGEALASRVSRRLTRRPELAAAIIGLLLLAGTATAFTLDSGPASVGLLPPGNASRLQYEAVDKALGPGWGGPLEILVDGGEQPVTTPDRLTALARFQRELERDPGVSAVAGLSRVERSVRPLRKLPDQLEAFERKLKRSKRGLARLDNGVRRAHRGADRLSKGFADAATGADRLHWATGRTKTGADQLAQGLRSVQSGASQLTGGMDRALAGGGSLARGAQRARAGAQRLRRGLAEARASASTVPNSARVLRNALTAGNQQLQDVSGNLDGAQTELDTAWRALRRMTTGRTDPQYQSAVQAVGAASAAVTGVDPATGEPPDSGGQGATAGVDDAKGQFDLGLYLGNRMKRSGSEAQSGIERLSRGADDLDHGLDRVADGSDRVVGALRRLNSGGDELTPGLERLAAGAGALAGGLGEVQNGAGKLSGGLGSGASDSGQLVSGLGRIERGVRGARRSALSGAPSLGRLQRNSPNLFHSGYFILASIDGINPRERSQAGLLVNVDRGGHAARMLVIPTTGPLSAQTAQTRHRLEDRADELERQTGTTAVVAGPAATLEDYNDVMRSRVPLVVILLSLITVLVLAPVIRSLWLPLVAAALNILTVGATFGVLAIAFNGSLLGGPGYIDTIGVGTIITVIFGLSIDYEVFVLARMREEYLRTGDHDLAITNGLKHTARVVSGAAVIMIAVFFAFAISPFASIRDFGVGLAVAVFIDAFCVRLIALPAIMRLLGERSWWLPAWLERLLPSPAAPASMT